jgi:hypothetical protein
MTSFIQVFRAWQLAQGAADASERRLRKVVRNATKGGTAPSALLVGETRTLRAEADTLLAATFAAAAAACQVS